MPFIKNFNRGFILLAFSIFVDNSSKNNMIKLEVCSNSVQSSIEAQRGGAIRVELCDNLMEGGTTPSLSQIELSIQYTDIEINTIIRPRGGDFIYSDIEFETMKRDIEICGDAKCDGIVIGILNNDASIDKKRSEKLISIAHKYGMNVTFHRAFDRCANLQKSLEEIVQLGCNRILTSGGMPTALEGKKIIRQLIEQADNRIIIMPGGGITENNISELVRSTGLKEFHGSFRSSYKGGMDYTQNNVNKNIEEEYYFLQTDAKRVRLAIDNANSSVNS